MAAKTPPVVPAEPEAPLADVPAPDVTGVGYDGGVLDTVGPVTLGAGEPDPAGAVWGTAACPEAGAGGDACAVDPELPAACVSWLCSAVLGPCLRPVGLPWCVSWLCSAALGPCSRPVVADAPWWVVPGWWGDVPG